MGEPWDRPPFPTRGNSERILFEAIGRALMAWEDVEGEFAHLYSTFACGWPFDLGNNRKYGEPLNFAQRIQGLEQMACRFFRLNPSQEREGAFADIVRLANGWSLRRNDVAHGRARLMHWVINPNSPETLLTAPQPLKWCVIPAHFKGDKFTADNKPAYVLTSREMRLFETAFWNIARQAGDLTHEFELTPPPPPPPA
jgi:hypothetical protein